MFLLAGFLFFANGLNHPFMIDDHDFFNEMSRDPRNLWMNFVPDKTAKFHLEGPATEVYYRPLALVVPKFLHWFFGGKAFPMHLVNLLLFITAAWLLARFIWFVSGNAWFGLMTALFMLVHPLNGIVVNFKTAGIFALQLIFMISAARIVLNDKVSVAQAFKASALFIGAFFCHESAFILPLCLTALSVVVRRQSLPQAFKQSACLWITAGLYFLLRLKWASLHTNLFGKLSHYDMNILEHFASWFCTQWWYAAKFFAPEGIVISVIVPIVRQNVFLWILGGCAVWGLLIRAAVFTFTLRPWICLGIIWYLLGMVMLAVGSLFQEEGFLVEPHWFIFSSIGFYMALADAVLWAAEGKLRRIVYAAAGFLVAAWMLWGWSYNSLWNTERGYCFYWLKQNNFQPINLYIARSYFAEGKLDEAARHYEMALTSRYPDYLMYGNLGSIALLQGKLDLAEQYLQRALKIEPRAKTVFNSLAIVYVRKGQWDKAEEYFKRSIEANPYDKTAQRNLRMLEHYKKNNTLNPNSPVRVE